jgi:hypothetical protein
MGYYSYDMGTWHVVALNSNCPEVGGCFEDSVQERWLKQDLAAHPARCTLAYWHHAGFYADEAPLRPFWRALYAAGAEVVLTGHTHVYERAAPQAPDGTADPTHGIRAFTVGTGGHSLLAGPRDPLWEVRGEDTFGILALTLRPSGYAWRFVPVAGGTFADSGSGDCH